MTEVAKPTLYLIPVPMGDSPVDNVIPKYNIDVVRGLRYFIVENLRSARRALKQMDKSIDINACTFYTLNEHTDERELPSMLEPMAQGHSIGVLSEAGCPAIADPGADIVAIAQRRGYIVEPLVGPSSILLSLMGSGFNGQSFAFTGYLPIDGGARTARLREMERRIVREKQTQIFIETPYRNNRLISDLVKALPGNLKLCVASDITCSRQTIKTQTLTEWANTKYDYDKIPTIFLLYR